MTAWSCNWLSRGLPGWALRRHHRRRLGEPRGQEHEVADARRCAVVKRPRRVELDLGPGLLRGRGNAHESDGHADSARDGHRQLQAHGVDANRHVGPLAQRQGLAGLQRRLVGRSDADANVEHRQARQRTRRRVAQKHGRQAAARAVGIVSRGRQVQHAVGRVPRRRGANLERNRVRDGQRDVANQVGLGQRGAARIRRNGVKGHGQDGRGQRGLARGLRSGLGRGLLRRLRRRL